VELQCCAREQQQQWTAEEDKRLLRLQAARKSSFSIAAQLRRSVSAIRARLGALKAKSLPVLKTRHGQCRGQNGGPSMMTSVSMELKAEGASLIEIANALGRTEAVVKVRAHILKVKANSLV
jgi:DNA-binding CsgD family transcriptional regulator